MKNMETIKWISIIILLILLLFTCNRNRNNNFTKTDNNIIENQIIEKTIVRYKDSIIFKDSLLIKYLPVRDSVRKMNTNTLDSFYNAQTETETMNRDDCDTIIQGLVTEIEIQDTLIEILTDKTILQDSVVHNLEIMNMNFESMLTETKKELIEIEKELNKTEKKRRNNKIWMWVMTFVASVTTTILFVK